MNAPAPMPRATLDDLMRYDGRAELIDGRVVPIMSPGRRPNRVSFRIAVSLHAWATTTAAAGEVYVESMSFLAPPLTSGRQTFQPDVGYATPPFAPDEEDPHPRPPVFAAEVRSKNGYGPAPERDAALKRADYFAAGTLVVWDVDQRDRVIYCYSAADPATPRLFGPGDVADAEPAIPGWRVPVAPLM